MGGHKFNMVPNEIESSNADVFSVSESWLSKAIPDRVVECMNYNVIRLDMSWNEVGEKAIYPKIGGGLTCYIKSNIKGKLAHTLKTRYFYLKLSRYTL